MIHALTRGISPSIFRCELTHVERAPIDFNLACEQHANYEATLNKLGVVVERIEADPESPDCVFIEDTAILAEDFALLTRPGAQNRQKEVAAVERGLARHFSLERIDAPGTLDGGDVLIVGKTVWVGVGQRSNNSGVEQLKQIAGNHGYGVRPVPLGPCLHLKSAVGKLDEETLLINPRWLDRRYFTGFNLIEVNEAEPSAADSLLVDGTLLRSNAHPIANEELSRRGYRVATVDLSELAKAEGALTCCSLIFRTTQSV